MSFFSDAVLSANARITPEDIAHMASTMPLRRSNKRAMPPASSSWPFPDMSNFTKQSETFRVLNSMLMNSIGPAGVSWAMQSNPMSFGGLQPLPSHESEQKTSELRLALPAPLARQTPTASAAAIPPSALVPLPALPAPFAPAAEQEPAAVPAESRVPAETVQQAVRVNASAPTEELADEGKEKVKPVKKSIADALLTLEKAVDRREEEKKVKKEAQVAQTGGFKRPAAAKAKGCSKKKAAPGKVTKGKTAAKKPKKPLKAWPTKQQQVKMRPEGCSKCRWVRGCTRSCWVQRNYGPPPSK